MTIAVEEKKKKKRSDTKFDYKELDFDLSTLQDEWLYKTAIAMSQVFIISPNHNFTT